MKLVVAFCVLFVLSVCDATRNSKIKKKLLKSNRPAVNQEDDEYLVELQLDQTPCRLNGLWYNQHGSELYINQTDDTNFCGELRTAVELDQSNQNVELFGTVKGHVVGRLFTFNVFWKDGESVTTWSGQCHKPCDHGFFTTDHTTLHTTWLLTSRAESCNKHWMATRIGQDIFTRDSTLREGPRRGSATEGRNL